MSKKRSKNETKTYQLSGQELQSAIQTKDLGVLVTCDLAWDAHIKSICAKANKVLGLVKRVCRDIRDVETRKLLYCALVRPNIEYAGSLWSPYTANNRALLENIQRRATKFILQYPQDMQYTERLLKLDLLPLEYRRQKTDLLLLFKFLNGKINANFGQHLTPVTPAYSTRNFDPANFRPLSQHKQNYFRHSYFPRTVTLWNNLPSYIKSACTINSFKTLLENYYQGKMGEYHPP